MAKNKLVKNITIDKLAEIINKGFDGQMDYLKKNFETTDENFKKVDENFKKVDENFKKVDENFKKVFNQLKTMDDKLDDVSSVKHRVDYIENTLNIQPIKK
ncbi:MAG: hypothetical protein AAB509_01745 [Patescibacteria group bacterium]